MTDSLLAGAGLLSPSLAGTALAMDFMEEEQKRQMTIKAANVSLYYEHGGTPYVINLIDTPGHVDFSGKVNVPWCIDEIDDVGCSSMLVVEADVGGFDSHLAFLFLFHEVHGKRRPGEGW